VLIRTIDNEISRVKFKVLHMNNENSPTLLKKIAILNASHQLFEHWFMYSCSRFKFQIFSGYISRVTLRGLM